MKANNLEILDCTVRDGGYVNDWRFDAKMVREVYRALSKSGVDYVEIGFRGTERNFDPARFGPWRFTPDVLVEETTAGIEGARLAVMGDFGKISLEDFRNREESRFSMVRIAAHKKDLPPAIALLEDIKKKGYLVSLQAMGFSNFQEREILELKRIIGASGLDYFYIADSYGSIFPHDIPRIFTPFLELGTVKIGFHPHNSLQMAFANTLKAVEAGVQIVDSSIFGMGRGSGNLQTEILLSYFQKQRPERYNVIPVLNCIERYFVDLYGETAWGYQLPYLISGMFNCHPYYASELVKRREYSIEDIWKALEVVEKMEPVGFDPGILEKLILRGVLGVASRKAAPGAPPRFEEVKGTAAATGAVPYAGRHTGQDFLILANGPTLKEFREQVHSFIRKYDPVVMGANHLGGLFMPHYHAFNNKKRFVMYAETVFPASRILIGENIPPELIAEYVRRDYETLFFRDVTDTDFEIDDGRIQSNCRTISVLLAGVAVVMGAKRIFLAGMDGYLQRDGLTNTLFYPEKFDPQDHALNVERHEWNEKFLLQIDQYVQKRGQEGIHIITPTSHKTFYKGIDNYL